eukprot:1424032-Prymnesium_polylepis.1
MGSGVNTTNVTCPAITDVELPYRGEWSPAFASTAAGGAVAASSLDLGSATTIDFDPSSSQ